MLDVEDLTDYFRSLKRGFDKYEFQEKIELLGNIVDTFGLDYDDFHKLFKIWLNLSIPVTKWVSIGVCLVPRDKIERRTVEYALRWILSNNQNQISFSRIALVLDWLTAAMDNECIDMTALDMGYEVYYKLLTSYEILTPHAMKLVYTLTKPGDITRRRVVELNDIARIREAKKSKCRQIQVLLGLFKSYKPECVPESVPAFAVHTIFKKINPLLLGRFDKTKIRRNITDDAKIRLNWVNFNNSKKTKKQESLIPNIEFVNVGSKQYDENKATKTYLDFTEAGALLQYSLRHEMSRPARWRALLGNEAGITLLVTADHNMHAFLSHDLSHLLNDCFLSRSGHSAAERATVLRALSRLQRAAGQGVPVVTRFLAHFLPVWNETDYFHEVLSLAEWVSVESPALVPLVLRPLGRAALRADPLRRLAILTCLANLHHNMVFASKRSHQHFLGATPSPHYAQLASSLLVFIYDITIKMMQIYPDDIRITHWSLTVWSRAALTGSLSPPPPPGLAHPLLAASPAILDRLAELMIIYKQIVSKERKSTNSRKVEDELWSLQAYTMDMLSCLWTGKALSERSNGLVFTKLPKELIQKLSKSVPNADSALTIRANPLFTQFDLKDMDHKLWFDTVVDPEYKYLSRFLKKMVPELKG